ncbi:hypothetical protein BC937DRAFT_95622 [Endogone sp. FLAS-F59071]|nr:hypothetical protein BC937DRAFT_95622 [Endogone sp. FLAS-F59071]|eukprot:RUS13257.1 hypothetical protein BC937DRAFT_95622 [Endogone sp. FLAS-F59071]
MSEDGKVCKATVGYPDEIRLQLEETQRMQMHVEFVLVARKVELVDMGCHTKIVALRVAEKELSGLRSDVVGDGGEGKGRGIIIEVYDLLGLGHCEARGVVGGGGVVAGGGNRRDRGHGWPDCLI